MRAEELNRTGRTAPDFLDGFLIIIIQQPQGQAASDEPPAEIET